MTRPFSILGSPLVVQVVLITLIVALAAPSGGSSAELPLSLPPAASRVAFDAVLDIFEANPVEWREEQWKPYDNRRALRDLRRALEAQKAALSPAHNGVKNMATRADEVASNLRRLERTVQVPDVGPEIITASTLTAATLTRLVTEYSRGRVIVEAGSRIVQVTDQELAALLENEGPQGLIEGARLAFDERLFSVLEESGLDHTRQAALVREMLLQRLFPAPVLPGLALATTGDVGSDLVATASAGLDITRQLRLDELGQATRIADSLDEFQKTLAGAAEKVEDTYRNAALNQKILEQDLDLLLRAADQATEDVARDELRQRISSTADELRRQAETTLNAQLESTEFFGNLLNTDFRGAFTVTGD